MFIRGLIEFPIIIAIILILLFVPQYQSKFFEKDIIIKIIIYRKIFNLHYAMNVPFYF